MHWAKIDRKIGQWQTAMAGGGCFVAWKQSVPEGSTLSSTRVQRITVGVSFALTGKRLLCLLCASDVDDAGKQRMLRFSGHSAVIAVMWRVGIECPICEQPAQAKNLPNTSQTYEFCFECKHFQRTKSSFCCFVLLFVLLYSGKKCATFSERSKTCVRNMRLR